MTDRARSALRGPAAAGDAWMRLEAAEWGVSIGTAWALAVGPLVFAAVVAGTALYRPLYRVFVEEDGIVEWAQIAALIALVVVGLLVAARLWHRHERSFAGLFVIAALAAFFIAGEEISWGQRLLGWATPEDLAALNRQGETNIHNVGSVLQFMNLAMFLVTVAAAILPLGWRWGAGDRKRDIGASIFVPPLFLATSFGLAGAYRLVRYALVPEGQYVVSRYGEVGELLLYGALVVFSVLLYGRLGRLAGT
jgi:hypothetical protein